MSKEKLDPTNELEVEEKLMEGVEEEVSSPEDDLNKKNYVKISPTFYVQYVYPEKPPEEGEEKEEIYKILNPKTGVVETRELTEEEKHEIVVKELKDSKKTFNPLSHPVKTEVYEVPRKFYGTRKEKSKTTLTNITVNKFDSKYKKKRKQKNKLTKASRRANRKK